MHTSCKKQSAYLPLAIYGEGGRGVRSMISSHPLKTVTIRIYGLFCMVRDSLAHFKN